MNHQDGRDGMRRRFEPPRRGDAKELLETIFWPRMNESGYFSISESDPGFSNFNWIAGGVADQQIVLSRGQAIVVDEFDFCFV